MKNCTNVCGLTVAALREAGETGLEVRRPSGKVLRVSLTGKDYTIDEPSREEPGHTVLAEVHSSLSALKKALREY
ncbi:hypothetical protein AIIMSPlu_059 [Pseudomonas phage AIIMS-Plu-RaNi]|nr:hypothetical protein AIIMSPlu_059 [Pseudomonas phage AIIMS-Plu-RaNi]